MTVPASTARTGVPTGAAIPIPSRNVVVWPTRSGPKLYTIPPSTGQFS